MTDAVVTRVGNTPATFALAGYYVAAASLTPQDLRVFLLDHLPEYLVPSFLLPIPAIPLTTNGKIDRAALPMPGNDRAGRARRERAITSELATEVSQAWHLVQGRNPRGPDDPISVDRDLTVELRLTTAVSRCANLRLDGVAAAVRSSVNYGELVERLYAIAEAEAHPRQHGTSRPPGQQAAGAG